MFGAGGVLRGASLLGQVLRRYTAPADGRAQRWEWLVDHGLQVNPCNSPLHPAVIEAGIPPKDREQKAVQDAYTPTGTCFGCGPANPNGLHLKSHRGKDGMEGFLSVPDRFQAFPGVISGGIITTALECHGSWSAAIALMDRACLPLPPLTVTATMLVTYRHPTPPNQPLVLRSRVLKVNDVGTVGLTKEVVEVDVFLYHVSSNGDERLLAVGEGVFKKHGAVRSF